MSNQRIYRGGTQYHEHAAVAHPVPALHDGYWRHYHDEAGMVAVEEDRAASLDDVGLNFDDLEVIRKALALATSAEDGHGDPIAAEVYRTLLGRLIDSALGVDEAPS
jgi:hypothetical protein